METTFERPSRDQYFVSMALLASMRGTCCRRKVGCVLINHMGHVLATGYNGPAAGQPHCIEEPCAGANCASGHGLELCEALHSEQNALLQCRDVYAITTAYVTASPCISCVKLLLNTSCHRIVYIDEYPHPAAKKLWESAGRKWEKFDEGSLLSVIKIPIDRGTECEKKTE